VLEAAAITRRFARTLALDRVDFRAHPGDNWKKKRKIKKEWRK